MKKSLLFVIYAFAVVGCSDDSVMDKVTTADETQHAVDEGHSVALSDVLTLAQAQNPSSRGAVSAPSSTADIVCITANNNNDTVLYMCNNANGGWTMYSSDTRVPPIVAQSSAGTISAAMQNKAMAAWVNTMAEDMLAIRNAEDSLLNFSTEEIESSKEFWRAIADPTHVVAHPDKDLPPIEYVPTGHYVLISSTVCGEVYDSIPRMISTNWHQGNPCNGCCPYQSNEIGRVPAGCVPIAAAQMLYFLHYSIGVPTEAPSAGYCNSSVNDPERDWDQYNYTSTIWDPMTTDGFNSAPLIADIGRRLNVHYTDTASSAFTSNLVNDVFLPYGISCTYASYDDNIVKNSLKAGMPVLLRALATESGGGHAFLTDRYIQKKIVIKNVYQYVYDPRDEDPNNPIIFTPDVPDKIEYSYTSPQVTMIGMNWGWVMSINDSDEWYTLTGDWEKSGYHWNNSRAMVHGFKAATN